MDFFSHVTAGWVLSEGLQLTRKEKKILIIGSIFPDVDIFIGLLLYLFVDHDLGRNFHREIMHTPFFGLIFGIILVLAIKNTNKKQIFLCGFIGVVLHCLLDQIVSFSFKYPKLFYPLSNATLKLNQIGMWPLIVVNLITYLVVWISAFKLYKATSKTPINIFRKEV